MKDLIEEFTKQKEEFQNKMKIEFKKLIEGFFKANPNVEAICWNQYTPYFNDGEECVFRVCDPSFVIKNLEEFKDIREAFYENSWGVENVLGEDAVSRAFELSSYKIKDLPEIQKKKCESYNEIVSLLVCGDLDDIFKAMFDDHVTVCIKSDGEIVTEELNHD